MTTELGIIRLADFVPAAVNRRRLARYLELPSVAQLDPVTDAEINTLDERRHELLASWQRAVVIPIGRIDGPWIGLKGAPPLEATEAYGQMLLESGADALIVAAFTMGGRIDEVIKRHLDRGDVYEAFVLKQWAATMTEQARAELTRSLRAWAGRSMRSLLPFDGPGYNGWPLRALEPLLEVVYGSDVARVPRPVGATASGVLLPTNSMLIVHGLARPGAAGVPRVNHDERLAQCHRCAMPNCNYRVTPLAMSGVGAGATPEVNS